MLLSVVIPAYNESACLPRTLENLRRGMSACGLRLGADWEIVVADNASTDATAALARAGGARVVVEPHRQIARARNRGAEAARGNWLLFLDADTEPPVPTLRQLIDTLRRGRVIGGGARVRFPAEAPQFVRASVFWWEIISCLTHWAAGSFLFVEAEAFRAVGGFNEELYASEEIDLSRKLKTWGAARGRPFRLMPGAIVRSSDRKFRAFGPGRTLRMFLPFLLRPRQAVRRRERCGYWYEHER